MKHKQYVIAEHFLPEGLPCDSGERFKEGKPDSVTIHWIGPYTWQTPEMVRDWWEMGGGEGSAHFIIQGVVVWQCWPLDKVCWHCGNLEGNRSSIAIEVVPCTVAGEFSLQSIATLKALLDDLFPGLPLYRHYDWSGKDCPRYYVDEDRWKSLKALLGRS